VRIAYVCADPGIPLGGVKGASLHMRSLAAALARRGHELLVVCARTEGPNPAPPGALVVELPLEAQAGWLVRKFDSAGIETVLERYSLQGGAALEAARALGLPFTLEVNAPLVEEAARFRGLQDVEMWRERELRLLAEADRVVVVSTALLVHALAAGARPAAVTVVPNGVQLELFRRGGGESMRNELGIDAAIVIGFAGSLKPWHGVGRLLEAFASLPSSCRLLVVGEGPERNTLEAQARRLGLGARAIFTGAVLHAQIPAYLDAMDVGAAPFEPMAGFYFSPLKVVEYLAAGLPVVASRQGDLPLLVGDAGILYEPGGQDALTDALRRLAGDAELRSRLGRNAVARAATLDWDSVAARVEGVLAAELNQGMRA
jgi:glycosyltransferase involved in cell wall biosynthesis